MPERAHLTSVEALESFRASLIVYLNKARPTLEEVSGDVLRTRLWLENDQRVHWENQIRRRSRLLEQAQQALFSAKLADPHHAPDAEQVAVRRARQALEEAESKLKCVKKWSRDFDSRIEPLEKQLDHLRNILATDMAQAVAHLAHLMKTLADYADVVPPSLGASPGPQAQSNPAVPQQDPGAAATQSVPGSSSPGTDPIP